MRMWQFVANENSLAMRIPCTMVTLEAAYRGQPPKLGPATGTMSPVNVKGRNIKLRNEGKKGEALLAGNFFYCSTVINQH